LNLKPEILETLLEIKNTMKSKQSYRYKVSSLVINNRLGIEIKIIYQQKVYSIEDEIKSLDVSRDVIKTDYNMDLIELIGNDFKIKSEDMIKNFQEAIDRIELAEGLKAISFNTDGLNIQKKTLNNLLQIQISPDCIIDMNLSVEGKFLTPLNNKDYKIALSTSVINGTHHIEIKPCLEIVNKTSHKFYVILFKKTLDKTITRSSSLSTINADSLNDKPLLIARGSKRLNTDDVYNLPYMSNIDQYFIKICVDFDNSPTNVYNVKHLLKNKSASVSTNEDVR